MGESGCDVAEGDPAVCGVCDGGGGREGWGTWPTGVMVICWWWGLVAQGLITTVLGEHSPWWRVCVSLAERWLVMGMQGRWSAVWGICRAGRWALQGSAPGFSTGLSGQPWSVGEMTRL